MQIFFANVYNLKATYVALSIMYMIWTSHDSDFS